MTLIEKLLVTLFVQELDLSDQNVWIRNQNRKIPETEGVFVIVGFTDGQPISNQTYMEQRLIGSPAEKIQFEVNRVQMAENIQIDILSRNNDALERRWELLAAIKSFRSQQMQEANFCKIFPISTNFLNSSIAEGGSMINRFTLTLRAFTRYEKVRAMASGSGIRNYYDTYPTRFDDEKTIGTDVPVFEFELPLPERRALAAESGAWLMTEDGNYLIEETPFIDDAIL